MLCVRRIGLASMIAQEKDTSGVIVNLPALGVIKKMFFYGMALLIIGFILTIIIRWAEKH